MISWLPILDCAKMTYFIYTAKTKRVFDREHDVPVVSKDERTGIVSLKLVKGADVIWGDPRGLDRDPVEIQSPLL